MSESPSKEEILALWLEGKLPEKEVIAALGREEWEAQKKILEISSEFSTPFTKSKAEAWEIFSSNISHITEEAVVVPFFKSRNFFYLSSAIAAAITLLVAVFIFLPSETQYQTKSGEQITFYLPDSSSVILNAQSTIAFRESSWDTNRELSLEGEAFFSVKKGSTFTVKTAKSTVEVLGTRFNIFSRTEKNQVSCYHGKVQVSDLKKTKTQVLEAGMELNIDDSGSFQVFSNVLEKTPDWSIGKFTYAQEPLENVIEELERQFDISISHPNLEKEVYNGAFLNNDLENALSLVCEPMGLTFKIENNSQVTLTRIP